MALYIGETRIITHYKTVLQVQQNIYVFVYTNFFSVVYRNFTLSETLNLLPDLHLQCFVVHYCLSSSDRKSACMQNLTLISLFIFSLLFLTCSFLCTANCGKVNYYNVILKLGSRKYKIQRGLLILKNICTKNILYNTSD